MEAWVNNREYLPSGSRSFEVVLTGAELRELAVNLDDVDNDLVSDLAATRALLHSLLLAVSEDGDTRTGVS